MTFYWPIMHFTLCMALPIYSSETLCSKVKWLVLGHTASKECVCVGGLGVKENQDYDPDLSDPNILARIAT